MLWTRTALQAWQVAFQPGMPDQLRLRAAELIAIIQREHQALWLEAASAADSPPTVPAIRTAVVSGSRTLWIYWLLTEYSQQPAILDVRWE